MNPADISQLPLTKRATPAQILILLAGILTVFICGASAAWWAFDSRNTVINAIQQVDAKVQDVKSSQEWMRRASLNKSEFAKWVNQLDRMNRASVPALAVPEPPEAVSSSGRGNP